MRPVFVALICSIVPILAVHIAYVSNVFEGRVPQCFPYVEGCLSISRAARSGDSIYVFRAMMMPISILLAIYWMHTYEWIKQLHPTSTLGMMFMRVLGATGALFLILYVTYLGTDGDVYRWMRRYGVIVYFSFTALAQILFVQRLHELRKSGTLVRFGALVKVKLVLCLIQWGLGLISVAVDALIVDKIPRDVIRNIIEWNFALVMHAFFFITYLMFKATDFKIMFSVKKTP